MSTVYHVAARRTDTDQETQEKIDRLWEAAGFDRCFRRYDLTAVKLHVGEPGKTTYVRPSVAAALVKRLRGLGTRPFTTDSCVLYRSPRNNGVGHSRVAADHGFTLERVGAPFIPADGLSGEDEVELPVDGKHFRTVSIAASIARARSLLILSHATGHLATGFGGALKNLGMGCGTKKAKLQQHFGQQPRIDPETCTGCGECAAGCPVGGIEVRSAAVIDEALCVGCGACIARCLENAVHFDWSVSGRELQERIVEHAAAIVLARPERIAYVTCATSITKDCDCIDSPQSPICEDIGILASHDPVAIDDAILRMVSERTGRTLESLSYPTHDGSIQIRYAEKMGLGRRATEIVTIDG